MPDVYHSFVSLHLCDDVGQLNRSKPTSYRRPRGRRNGTSRCSSTRSRFPQQLRLWDALFLEGRDVIIMTSLAILWAFRGERDIPRASGYDADA